MSGPIHFDMAEAEAGISKAIAEAAAGIRQQTDRTATQNELEIAGLHFVRAMSLLVFEASNMNAPREEVADAAGFAIANAINLLCQNLECGCVRGRTLKAIAMALPTMTRAEPSVSVIIKGVEGGRA